MTEIISHPASVLNRGMGFIFPLENVTFSTFKFWIWVYSHWSWVWPQFTVYSHITVLTAVLQKEYVAAMVLLSWTAQGRFACLQPAGTAPLTSTGVNSLTIQSSEATYEQPAEERNLKNFIFQLDLKWKWLICRTALKEAGFCWREWGMY